MKCVDLFAGCGGLSLGFQQAGFDVIAAFDNWKPAIDVYQANFSHPIIEQDLAQENIIVLSFFFYQLLKFTSFYHFSILYKVLLESESIF